jgi:hypothetical protein
VCRFGVFLESRPGRGEAPTQTEYSLAFVYWKGSSDTVQVRRTSTSRLCCSLPSALFLSRFLCLLSVCLPLVLAFVLSLDRRLIAGSVCLLQALKGVLLAIEEVNARDLLGGNAHRSLRLLFALKSSLAKSHFVRLVRVLSLPTLRSSK